MHARVTHSTGSPASLEEVSRLITQHVIPVVQKQAGFRGGYWMFDRATGKRISFTLWDSEQAMQSSAASAQQLRDQAPGGTQITGVEGYEVFARA